MVRVAYTVIAQCVIVNCVGDHRRVLAQNFALCQTTMLISIICTKCWKAPYYHAAVMHAYNMWPQVIGLHNYCLK